MTNPEDKLPVQWSCRFHPTDWFHEVGCPHQEWTKEQLQDALETKKRFEQSRPSVGVSEKEIGIVLEEAWQDCLDDGSTNIPIDGEVLTYQRTAIIQKLGQRESK